MTNLHPGRPIQQPASPPPGWVVTRRDFLQASGAVLAGLTMAAPVAGVPATDRGASLRFGMVTDPHYADTAARGTRYYRESLVKMEECVTLMNEQKVDFLIELGDLKDEGDPASEDGTLRNLEAIEAVLGKFSGPRYHLLGNHDMDSISKPQFLERVENTGIPRESSYYSFDAKGIHVVVLDANFKADGSDYDHGNFVWTDTHVPAAEFDWLRQDLAASSGPVLVFVHQLLDGEEDFCVRNAAALRDILQQSGRVLAVFHGHNHSGRLNRIKGISYYTLKAMVEGTGAENNSYAIVEVFDDLRIVITGYRRAVSRELARDD